MISLVEGIRDRTDDSEVVEFIGLQDFLEGSCINEAEFTQDGLMGFVEWHTDLQRDARAGLMPLSRASPRFLVSGTCQRK
jgi:hypothetical protein